MRHGTFTQGGKIRPGVRLVVAAVLSLFLTGVSSLRAEEIVVVVNAKAPVTQVSAEQVRAIYLGEVTFWDGVRVVPVGYQDGFAVQQAFLERVVRLDETRFKTYWIRRIFQEGGVPPKKATSQENALDIIARHEGGIGFVLASHLPMTEDIREVLRIPN